MNNLVTREHDKFSQKTTTTSISLQVDQEITSFIIQLRHVSAPKIDSMVIDIQYLATDWMFIRNGKLILNINGTKNLTLDPHEQGTDATGHGVMESAFYNITPEQLLMLCNAKSIEYKLSGSNTYVTGEFNENMQLICKAMYNAIYDHSKFKKEIAVAEEQQESISQRWAASTPCLFIGWGFGVFALIKSVIALDGPGGAGTWFILAVASATIGTIAFIILRSNN